MTPTPPLDIAAPAAALDPLAPWIGARSTPERALAATYLTSFGALSCLFHGAGVVLALVATMLPLPLLGHACSSVKPARFAPPERVEVAIVEVEPPPVLEEVLEEVPPPPPEEPTPAAPQGAKAKRLAAEIEQANVGVLALLGSQAEVSGVFGSLNTGDESAVLGALVGNEIGDAFGVGGLGLSGVGVGGGGMGEGTIGLGGLGTLGHGGGGTGAGFGVGAGRGGLGSVNDAERMVRIDVVETDLDRAAVRRALLKRRTALQECGAALPADFTLRMNGGAVTAAEGAPACVAQQLMGVAVAGSGYAAVHLELR